MRGMTRHMTLPEAAKMLGVTPWTLRRRLLAVEAKTGRTFIVRHGGNQRVRYLVTLSLLKLHCPELFDAKSEFERLVAERFEKTNEALFELKRRNNANAAKIRSIDGRVLALETAAT